MVSLDCWRFSAVFGMVLILLHKPKTAGVYLQTQFVEKEPKLASSLMHGLLRHWPITNSQKEVMFLGEIEEVLEASNMVELQKCMVPLFQRVAHCINSSHFQVAERALFMWNNDHIISLVAQNRQVIVPIFVPALERNSKNHWNQSVLNPTVNLKKMLSEMDEELFSTCLNKYMEGEDEQESLKQKRKLAWERLESALSIGFPASDRQHSRPGESLGITKFAVGGESFHSFHHPYW